MYCHESLFIWKPYLAILHISHILPGSLVFGNSDFAILHILHVLPWVSLFLEVIFDNITHITHITRGPWFLEIQNLQYYTYYMYYHGSLFFGKSNLAILHILPGVLVFYKLKYCNITHITCITMGLSFLSLKLAILHVLHILHSITTHHMPFYAIYQALSTILD